jgi:hypothetical protein
MKYEYKILYQYVNADSDKEKNERDLNELGQAGWRIEGITTDELGRMVIYLTREAD